MVAVKGNQFVYEGYDRRSNKLQSICRPSNCTNDTSESPDSYLNLHDSSSISTDSSMCAAIEPKHSMSIVSHPLRHAIMDALATMSETSPNSQYFLLHHDLYISHSPCIMCTMALVHSRVQRVFIGELQSESWRGINPFGKSDGYYVHGMKSLHHRFQSYSVSFKRDLSASKSNSP